MNPDLVTLIIAITIPLAMAYNMWRMRRRRNSLAQDKTIKWIVKQLNSGSSPTLNDAQAKKWHDYDRATSWMIVSAMGTFVFSILAILAISGY